MSHGITVGSTNAFMYFRAYNTDNTALLTLTSATTALALNVYRAGSTDVAISSLTDKSDPDDAHSDGAIYQIGGSNLYSIDVPDAAVATQVPSVIIEGSFTGGFIDGIPHPINGYDPTDAVRIGMTALPNAAADAAGGFPVSDAGGLDLDNDTLTQVNAALDTAIAELAVAAPTATPSLRTGLMLLYMALRNKLDVQTSGTDALEIHNDAGTMIAKKLITDTGEDYSEAEMVSG